MLYCLVTPTVQSKSEVNELSSKTILFTDPQEAHIASNLSQHLTNTVRLNLKLFVSTL